MVKVAVVGCCHGELDVVYDLIEEIQARKQVKIDLVIMNGDFQAIRNRKDLESMAVPAKYAKIKQFWKYYSGRRKAPVLTLVIGGNHECSNYMAELPYGGWLAPNIYYLGKAGVLNFQGLRIAGLSGIYSNRDFLRGHYECPPFDCNSQRSIYHVRNLEVFRLQQLQDGRQLDIFLSHDWPQSIYRCGNESDLLRRKPFLRDDIYNGRLGNPHSTELLTSLKPRYWFSAHHHCKFAASVQHEDSRITHFLALDKCLPGRQFMQVIDITPQGKTLFGNSLCLDPEWLSILKSTDHLLSTSPGNVYMPGSGARFERYDFKPTDEELSSIQQDFNGIFSVPSSENVFVRTSPVRLPITSVHCQYKPFQNPQTTLMCQMLDVRDPVEVICAQQHRTMEQPEELEDGEIYDDGDDPKESIHNNVAKDSDKKSIYQTRQQSSKSNTPLTTTNTNPSLLTYASRKCSFSDKTATSTGQNKSQAAVKPQAKIEECNEDTGSASPLGNCIQLPPVLSTSQLSEKVIRLSQGIVVNNQLNNIASNFNGNIIRSNGPCSIEQAKKSGFHPYCKTKYNGVRTACPSRMLPSITTTSSPSHSQSTRPNYRMSYNQPVKNNINNDTYILKQTYDYVHQRCVAADHRNTSVKGCSPYTCQDDPRCHLGRHSRGAADHARHSDNVEHEFSYRNHTQPQQHSWSAREDRMVTTNRARTLISGALATADRRSLTYSPLGKWQPYSPARFY